MQNFQRSAFRNGFARGFASPSKIFFSELRHYNVGEQNLVAVSWRQVGETVRDALEKEKVTHGKSSRASSK